MGDVKAEEASKQLSEEEKVVAAAAPANADDDPKASLSALVADAERAVSAASGDDKEALAALEKLRGFKVTSALLLDTGAGKRVRALSKESSQASAEVAAAAKRVVAEWKAAVVGGSGGGAANGNGNDGNGNDGGSAPSTSAPSDKKRPKEEEEDGGKAGTATTAPTATEEEAAKKKKPKTEGGEEAKTETEAPQPPPPPPPSLPPPPPPTGDPARDKARALLAAALDLVPRDELRNATACPATVAAAVESAVLEDHGDGKARKLPGARYKAKLRSLLFNLKDASNPDARRRALNGDLTAVELVRAGPEELASDARKAENEAIRAAALFEAERGQKKNLATTDQFRCGKCRQHKCTYYQMQTRSADEPMTTFVQCVNCGNRWRFC